MTAWPVLRSALAQRQKVIDELVRLDHLQLSQPAVQRTWNSEAERIEYVEKWPLAWAAARALSTDKGGEG